MSKDALKNHPLLKFAIELVVKRIESAIAVALLLLWEQHHVHNQVWQETGDHFQDNVADIQDLQMNLYGFVPTNHIK